MDRISKEHHILTRAIERARRLGVDLSLRHKPDARQAGSGPDATIVAKIGRRELVYSAEVKAHVRAHMIGLIEQRLGLLGKNALLVADYLSPQIADELRRRGIQFLDTAGNAFLRGPSLYVFVKGEKAGGEHGEPRPSVRAFGPTGLAVVFALLAKRELLDATVREMARATDVAHGTVGWVMNDLRQLGFLVEVEGRRRLVQAERLLDLWTEAYIRALAPRLRLGRYQGDLSGIKAPLPDLGSARVGGELGGALLTRHLRPQSAYVYTQGIDPSIVRPLKLKADPNGNVEVRTRFWNFETEPSGFAPPLLIYADLLAIGDPRCLEMAQIVRKEHLDRPVGRS